MWDLEQTRVGADDITFIHTMLALGATDTVVTGSTQCWHWEHTRVLKCKNDDKHMLVLMTLHSYTHCWHWEHTHVGADDITFIHTMLALGAHTCWC
jgi:hypothetical protein